MVASSEEVLAPMSSWELPCVGGSPAVAGVEIGGSMVMALLLPCSIMT